MERNDVKNKCGIYIIKNKINGKFYIGSSNNIWRRWQSHRYELRTNSHGNKHLQSAWNKYGEENFEFDVLEFCDEEVQFDREQEYLDKYWGNPMFYNENNNAICPPKQDNKGINHPQAKIIYVYNKDGLIRRFDAVIECAKWMIDNSIINSESKNQYQTVSSYIRRSIKDSTLYKNLLFSYKPLSASKIRRIYINKELNKKNRYIEVIKDGVSLGVFKSSYEIEDKSELLFGIKLNNSNIRKVCKGRKDNYKGFTFRYLTKIETRKYICEHYEEID